MSDTPTENTSTFVSRYRLLLLLLILLGAMGLRLHRLGEENYWLDEAHSMINSAGHATDLQAVPLNQIIPAPPQMSALSTDSTLRHVWRAMRSESHPPLYFEVLLLWRKFFGDDELTVRLLPALFSILAIIPFFVVMCRTAGAKTALWAAAFLAVAYVNIRMGQNNRHYSLGLFWACAASWCCLKLIPPDDPSATCRRSVVTFVAGFAGVIALALLTHYFTIWPVVAMVIFCVLGCRKNARLDWAGSIRSGFGFVLHHMAERIPCAANVHSNAGLDH